MSGPGNGSFLEAHRLAPWDLRARRRALHLSQADLAHVLGVRQNTVARWERGELAMRNPVLVNLALHHLEQGITPEQLLDRQYSSLGTSRKHIGKGHTSKSSSQPIASPRRLGSRYSIASIPNRLIGREQELGQLQPLLLREDVRLLTLTGAAGVGKTTLALALAYRLVRNFRHGAVCIDLCAICETEAVLPAIAHGLALRDDWGHGPLEEYLKQFLAPRHLLIVLDNFEQVIGAAPMLSDLLAACPRLKLLVTSRTALRISWEHAYEIPTLGLTPAVALFAERAQAIQPTFSLTEENSRATAEVCMRLDGLPLAIELAAARVKVLPPPALVRRLESALDVLEDGPADRPTRHRSLRAALEWSYELLTPTEQRLFRQLSFFGSFTLEAAERLAGGPVLQNLSGLVEKSLVQQIPSGVAKGRFRLPEVVREYGREQARRSGEIDEFERRHATYFAALVEQLAPELHGPRQLACLDQIDQEQDNLRAALRWSAEQQEAETMLQMGAALWEYWWMRGYLAEGEAWLETALAHSGDIRSTLRGQVLNGAGVLASARGNHNVAWERFCDSEKLLRSLGDKRALARVLADQGTCLHIRGDSSAAVERLEEAAAQAWEVDARWEVGYALECLGATARSQRGDIRTDNILGECLALFEGLGDNRGAAYVRLRLAEISLDHEDVRVAADHACSAVRSLFSLGDCWGLVLSMVALARAAAGLGHYRRSAWLLGVIDGLCDNTGAVLLPEYVAAVEQVFKEATTRKGRLAARERSRGRSLKIEKAIATMLACKWQRNRCSFLSPEAEPDARGLTSRECEVAKLVGLGLTNREVGERLVISERTVEGHIERIRGKLGLRSRIALATWVVAHHLA